MVSFCMSSAGASYGPKMESFILLLITRVDQSSSSAPPPNQVREVRQTAQPFFPDFPGSSVSPLVLSLATTDTSSPGLHGRLIPSLSLLRG